MGAYTGPREGRAGQIDAVMERCFADVILNVKGSLDAHLEVYAKADGVRTTSYDEAVSISATARTAYEYCARVEQFLTIGNIRPSQLNEKHKLCLKLTRKLIYDTNHNNIIVDHPRADPVAYGVGLVRFLEALHYTLAEVTNDSERYKRAKAFLLYNQERHADDPNIEARIPSLAEEVAALLQEARA